MHLLPHGVLNKFASNLPPFKAFSCKFSTNSGNWLLQNVSNDGSSKHIPTTQLLRALHNHSSFLASVFHGLLVSIKLYYTSK